MPWPVQNLLALVHLYDDLLTNFEVSNLDEEPGENDSRQCHVEFDKGMSARRKTSTMIVSCIILSILIAIKREKKNVSSF